MKQVLLVSLSVFVFVGCESRQQHGVVVDNPSSASSAAGGISGPATGDAAAAGSAGSLPAASASSAAAATGTTDPTIIAYINGWDGAQDQIPSTAPWQIKTVDAASSATAPASTGSAAPSSAPQVTYNDNVAAILNANCVSCHSPTGSHPSTPMNDYAAAKNQGAGIIARATGASANMPKAAPLSAADQQTLLAWQAAGFPESAAAASGSATPATSSTPSLGGTSTVPGSQPTQNGSGPVDFHIKAGTGNGPWNTAETPVIAHVGQPLTIYNDDTVPHEWHSIGVNSTPCPHPADAIPPGGSATCTPSGPFQEATHDHVTEAPVYIYVQ